MSDAKSKKEEQAFLKVTASDGTIHLLPYGHLLHVFLANDPTGKEQLILRGAISAVMITGTGLSKLLEEIQSLTLKHIHTEKSAGACIAQIEVTIRESED